MKSYYAAAFAGGVVFLVIGYIAYAVADREAFDFMWWLTERPIERGSAFWFLAGCAVGCSIMYAARNR